MGDGALFVFSLLVLAGLLMSSHVHHILFSRKRASRSLPAQVCKIATFGALLGCLFRHRFWTHFGTHLGAILEPVLEPFWCHFGCLLKVDSPLRLGTTFPTFSCPSNTANSLKNHGFFDVFAMSTKVWHEARMAPEWLQKGSRFGPKMSPKWLRSRSQNRSCFWDAFWTENGSQKGAQNDPQRGT